MYSASFFYAILLTFFITFVEQMHLFSYISIWWLLPLVLVSFFVTIVYYKKQHQLAEITAGKKRVLISLRALSIILLVLLLFDIMIERKEYKTEKPVFIALIDNSTSMLNYKDSATIKANVDKLTSSLKEEYQDRFDFKAFVVGTDFTSDSVNFSADESNLDKGFESIYSQFYNRNIGGICFISDGNFTTGKNPIYSARKISFTPVFSVGVGDTVIKKDQFIRSVSANQIAFFKNKFPIEVAIEATRMGKGESKVTLFKGAREIASQQVSYSDGRSDFAQVNFMVDADEIGFVEYSVRIAHKANEVNYENNTKRFYVEVVDSRSKILLLSQAPHPDVAALKSVFDQDENSEVDVKLTSDWDGNLNDYALLVWHHPSDNKALINQINSTKIPVLYLLTSEVNGGEVNALNIGLKLATRRGVDEVQSYPTTSFQLFELSDGLINSMQQWPPLKVPFGKIENNQGSVLLKQRIGGVKKEDPILYFGGDMNKKFGVIIGEGLWRWKLTDYVKTTTTSNFTELIQKTAQYLTVKKNTDPLRVILPKRFNKKDDIVITAEYYNASLERITSPKITFELRDDENRLIQYEFAKQTSDYSLTLGKLKPGKYLWTAESNFESKKTRKQGVFVVEDVSIELLSTHANHNLMRQLATETNGAFYTLDKRDKLIKDVGNRKDIVSIQYEESNFNDLIDWQWIFLLAFVLLAAEWFLRRYWGSY